MVIGLTGGMGCGKSTVARRFEDLGFRRMDSDEVVRDHIMASPGVIAAIAQRFGSDALLPNGEVNRSWLGDLVFKNAGQLLWLENLLHPLLFAHWRQSLRESETERWVFEVPLLFEKQLENWFDFTLCVTSTRAHQLIRLEQRGITRAHAELRISKQLPLARKVELADFVIGNDGTPDFLRLQVDAWVGSLPPLR
ncbi:MAG TPA: dephospho-CoA kinase [Opitutaceae bacterium]|nr:dephospho-CoA kinase [Opitutaceae bacterium]